MKKSLYLGASMLAVVKQAQFAHLAVHVSRHFWSLIEEETPSDKLSQLPAPPQ